MFLSVPVAPTVAEKFMPVYGVTLDWLIADKPFCKITSVNSGVLPLCILNECIYSSVLPQLSSAVNLTVCVPLASPAQPPVSNIVIEPFLLELAVACVVLL